ncbi:MAG TPA: CPXCG motif-containing cysteine-rich protein [Pirellula sp.]|nr:CPXCG motif-containing cysteine-rich protein [Pirellula sp.]
MSEPNRKRKKKRKAKEAKSYDDSSYVGDSCGEDIVIPIDLSAGSEQQYVEDCPVCCHPNVVMVNIEEDGEIRCGTEPE